MLVDQNVVPMVVSLCSQHHSDDVRVQAMWVLRNLVFKAEPHIKHNVMSCMEPRTIGVLLTENSSTALIEQVFVQTVELIASAGASTAQESRLWT